MCALALPLHASLLIGNKPAGGRGSFSCSVHSLAQQNIPLKLVASFAHANNLPGGFDCPGCAFPDKSAKPMLDSCEQGQKAIAWEMTRKAVGADFFDAIGRAQV